MARRNKDTWEKNLEEFTFDEVIDWIVGCIIFGLARGETLRNIVYSCIQSLANAGKLRVK